MAWWTPFLAAGASALGSGGGSHQRQPGSINTGNQQQGYGGQVMSNLGGMLGNLPTSIGTKAIKHYEDKLTRKLFGDPNEGPSGGELGQRALDFDKARFPGTNPWERIGSSAPAGPVAIQRGQAKVQRHVVGKQTGTSLEIARIGARSAAVSAGAQIGLPNVQAAGDYAAHGTPLGARGLKGKSAARVGANAAAKNALTKEFESWIKQHQLELNKKDWLRKAASDNRNPATATLRALAARAFDIGLNSTDFIAWVRRNNSELLTAGVSMDGINAVIKAIPNFFLGVGRLGRRGRRPMSAPATPRRKVRIPRMGP